MARQAAISRLADTELNPLPSDTTCGVFTSRDGVRLRYARWPALRRPTRGTILIVQGRSEFIEKYFETVGDLRRRGFSVATFDLRGQGGSARLLRNPLKGHVDSFEEYVGDVDVFVRSIMLPDCPPPYAILAHSTGAAVALMYATRGRTQIDRILLTSPLLGLYGRSLRGYEAATSLLRYLGLGEAYAGLSLRRRGPVQLQQFDGNDVTSDSRRYQRNRAVVAAMPELGLGPPTVSWLHAAVQAINRFKAIEFSNRIPIPVLILMAGADRVVSNLAIERLCAQAKTCAYVRIPGAAHEIMMERDIYRDQFLAALEAFIPGRMPEEATEPVQAAE